MGNNTFSNMSENDLLLTQEAFLKMISSLKVDRLCFNEMPHFFREAAEVRVKINRTIAILDAISFELSLRKIREDVQG